MDNRLGFTCDVDGTVELQLYRRNVYEREISLFEGFVLQSPKPKTPAEIMILDSSGQVLVSRIANVYGYFSFDRRSISRPDCRLAWRASGESNFALHILPLPTLSDGESLATKAITLFPNKRTLELELVAAPASEGTAQLVAVGLGDITIASAPLRSTVTFEDVSAGDYKLVVSVTGASARTSQIFAIADLDPSRAHRAISFE